MVRIARLLHWYHRREMVSLVPPCPEHRVAPMQSRCVKLVMST